MNNSDYKINVDASVSSAQEKLETILEQFKELNKLADKGVNADHIMSGMDYDKSIKLSRDLTKSLKELYAIYDELGTKSPLAKEPGVMRNLAVELDRVRSQLDSVNILTNNIAGNMSKLSGVDKTYINEQRVLNNELSQNMKILQNIKRTEQDIKNARARVGRTVTRATDTGRIDYNNTRRLRGEVGRSEEYEQLRTNNNTRMASLRERRKGIQGDFINLGEDMQKGKVSDTDYRNRISSLKQERKEIDEEIKRRQSLNNTIDETINTLNKGKSVLGDKGIRQESDPSSFAGVMKSRAFAISISAIGASLGAMGAIYNKGKGIEQGIRGDAIQIGQQVGVSDYRGYKRQIANMGMQSSTGFTPEEMMNMAGVVLGGQGNLGKQATLDTTNALAKAKRSVAVTGDNMDSFMQSAMQNGSVSGAQGVQTITRSIAGAIKQGGMSGRDDEVLKALQQIADNTFAGRNGSSSELNNMVAINTMLNATGDKAVQGSAGAKLQTDLSSGIRNLSQDNPLSLWLGKGTQYQGLGGMWQMQRMQEKGLTADSLGSLVNGSRMYGSEGSDAQKMALYSAIKNGLGVDVSTDQVNSLMKVYNKTNGDPTAVQKELDKIKKSGKTSTDKNSSTYSSSAEGAKNLAEAVKAVKALETADNKLITVIDRLIGKLSGMNAMAYTGGAGLMAGATMLGGSAIASFASSAIKQGKIGKMASGAFESISNSKIGSILSSGAKGTDNLAGKAFNSVDDILKTGSTGSKLAGTGASGLLKGLGKVAIPIGIASSLYSVATAKDKTKAVGGEIGGWGGALAGASLGASLGSIVPGLGTVIGGIGGGIIGGIGGTAIGKGAVDAGRGAWKGIKGLFTGERVSADEITENDVNAGGQKKAKASSSQKRNSEQMRANNNTVEAQNLSLYKELLVKAQNILNQAKAQNGIFGNSNGSNASSGSSSSGLSGDSSLKILDKGKYWSTGNAKTSDLGTTVSGVSADSLNKWITSMTGGNSGMDGLGDTFMKAGEESGLDPRYLVAHAAVETGWGSSQLSKNGNTDTGNWFGIGAFDSNPSNGENYGLGIVGGAKWIADNYYKQGQTTVDSMRNNNGVHQYATDPNWDEKIASIMESSKAYTGASQGSAGVKVTNQINISTSSKDTSDTLANKIATALTNKTKSTLDYYTKEKARV